MVKNRLLFVDALRILGITLVVFQHIEGYIPYIHDLNQSIGFRLGDFYNANFGTLGVSIFLLASGFSLGINYVDVNSKERLASFYKNRVLRIYPAYWLAVFFAVMMNIAVIHENFSVTEYVRIVTGFQALGAKTASNFYGVINGNFWFISLILSIYIIAPIVIFAVKRHPHVSILSLLLLATVSSYYFGQGALFFRGIDWCPLPRIFDFGLGVYLIRMGLYPKWKSNKVTAYLGSISFYVYLATAPLLYLIPQSQTMFVAALFIIGSMIYTLQKAINDTLSQSITWLGSRARLTREGDLKELLS
jgi:peptidoglycan/LPS O-acetylase OafA/YrhL